MLWEDALCNDSEAFGRSMTEGFKGQVSMFPHMVTESVEEALGQLTSDILGYKLSGAGGGGYLVLFSEKPVPNTLKIRIRKALQIMRRFGQVIKVRPEKLDYYIELHANPWPGVLKMIQKFNIRNYSIFLLKDNMLFAYFEYIGQDFELDMALMKADKETQRWWCETHPCQESLNLVKGEWWTNMKEIFHT